ncbi:AAA family ATPase [Streptomyces sp. S1]|uniref:AAA family ATPase n=1 Tax=Streptomyces sp. S1 TaxID=718288 RepID=UPI003D70717B
MQFSQPAWTEESGLPYPGAEDIAEDIARNEERAAIDAQAKVEKNKALARRKGLAEAEAEADSLREIVVRRASSIQPKRVRWLWAPGDAGDGRIPLGELTLIVGRGGIGKSTLLAEFTAWITQGDMKGEFFRQPRDVMYVANEDSLEYTVTPRLIAAGADLDRVHFIGVNMMGREAKVILPSDCDGLSRYAQENGVAAIMLDPLSSNLRVKQNAGDEIRPVMEAVRRMAEAAGVACIGLAHTRKATSTNLLDALLGSVELGNVCRSAMGVMRDDDADDGSVILSQEKANLGRTDIDSYRYRIESATIHTTDETISTSRIGWLGRTDMRVSDMLSDAVASGMSVKSAVAEASDFIRDYLVPVGGQALRSEVVRAAKNEGYNDSAIKRAATKLKLDSVASGQGAKRLWVLPTSIPPET